MGPPNVEYVISVLGGAATCSEGFVNYFLRVPQAVVLYCSCHAAQLSKGNCQKTFYKTFGKSGRPALYCACKISSLSPVRDKGDSNFTHVLRSCFEPHYHNRSGVAPIKIPIRHYDDEADASGCIQFYNEDYMVTKISNPSGKVLGRSDPS